jgi:hypothetical protein
MWGWLAAAFCLGAVVGGVALGVVAVLWFGKTMTWQ